MSGANCRSRQNRPRALRVLAFRALGEFKGGGPVGELGVVGKLAVVVAQIVRDDKSNDGRDAVLSLLAQGFCGDPWLRANDLIRTCRSSSSDNISFRKTRRPRCVVTLKRKWFLVDADRARFWGRNRDRADECEVTRALAPSTMAVLPVPAPYLLDGALGERPESTGN